MDNSVKLTREQLLNILYGTAYNIDGSVVKSAETVRNYTVEVIDGKVHLRTFSVPIQILVNDEWLNVSEVVSEEDLGIIYDVFQEVHLDSEIILDTDNPTGISVRSRERVRNLPNLITEAGINLPREFTWVDGASNISGVIILPQDDYDKVFIATDPDQDGNPEIIFIEPKTEKEQERPYYVKEDGKTYIYVNHFSGGGGTQTDPYIISNEDDLDNVRLNLGAYYVQDADILLTKWQTGAGWNPIKTFTGHYDGRGFEIKDLYINRNENYVGLFGYASAGTVKRVKLVNVNIINKSGFTGSLLGRCTSNVYDCAVISGSVVGEGLHVGGLIGYKDTSREVLRCYSHADVGGSSANIGGLIGYHTGVASLIRQCLATGKVTDMTIAKTITEIGGFLGTGNASDENYFNIDTSGILISAGNAKGRSKSDLYKQSTYSGWDFDIWFKLDSKLNKGYPEIRRLIRYKKGKGTANEPYLLYDFEDLNQVRHYPWANFRMESDISIDVPTTGNGFLGIGFGSDAQWSVTNSEAFTGVFDGNGYTIGGLYMNRVANDYQALFTYFRGVLKNLTVTDAQVVGKSYVGAVIGYSSAKPDGTKSEVINVHVKSFNETKVRGVGSYIGGFIGYNYYITFTDCSVDAIIEGASHVGGFAGRVVGYSHFQKCKTKGVVVSLGAYAGGFYGSNESSLDMLFYDILTMVDVNGTHRGGFSGYTYTYTNYNSRQITFERVVSLCYSSQYGVLTGGLHGAQHVYYSTSQGGKQNYFDRQLAGIDTSGHSGGNTHVYGAPKYTTEMKHPGTYSEPSWDMVNVWILDSKENDGYPELLFAKAKVLPILGFRNKFGDYYTDNNGNILRYLEYGTLVAGGTSDAKPVWLQNNATFPVKETKVWVDPPTVKPGIKAELSLSNNPFVPTSEIAFAGSIPTGDSRQFYVRFSSDVTVTEGGTFDMKAKASPA
ncbi:halomucin [Metabacillus fastidiosus]|uniref:halomucin n=1 Tax=Metabacillus fastidiosus TaxID=1458 RepID=UPI003D2C0910